MYNIQDRRSNSLHIVEVTAPVIGRTRNLKATLHHRHLPPSTHLLLSVIVLSLPLSLVQLAYVCYLPVSYSVCC